MGELVVLYAKLPHKKKGTKSARSSGNRGAGRVVRMKQKCGHPVEDREGEMCLGCIAGALHQEMVALAKVIRESCPHCMDAASGSCDQHQYLERA